MQTNAAEKILFVLVEFDDGSEKEFAIVGNMPVVAFAASVRERFPTLTIRKTMFLEAPANLPRVAEVL